MATIRRNKYGRLVYATAILGATVTGWSTDPAAAVELDEPRARDIVDAHKAKASPNGGQLAALDAKGKTIALWGEPGEEPKPAPPPVSLPGLAERVRAVEERVDLIEASEAGVLFTKDEVATLKAMLAKPVLPSITEDQKKEIEALIAKSKTGQWVSIPEGHQLKLESVDPKANKAAAGTGGGQKVPAG